MTDWIWAIADGRRHRDGHDVVDEQRGRRDQPEDRRQVGPRDDVRATAVRVGAADLAVGQRRPRPAAARWRSRPRSTGACAARPAEDQDPQDLLGRVGRRRDRVRAEDRERLLLVEPLVDVHVAGQRATEDDATERGPRPGRAASAGSRPPRARPAGPVRCSGSTGRGVARRGPAGRRACDRSAGRRPPIIVDDPSVVRTAWTMAWIQRATPSGRLGQQRVSASRIAQEGSVNAGSRGPAAPILGRCDRSGLTVRRRSRATWRSSSPPSRSCTVVAARRSRRPGCMTRRRSTCSPSSPSRSRPARGRPWSTAIGAFLVYDLLFVEPRFTLHRRRPAGVAEPPAPAARRHRRRPPGRAGAGPCRDGDRARARGDRHVPGQLRARPARRHAVAALPAIVDAPAPAPGARRVWIEVADRVVADSGVGPRPRQRGPRACWRVVPGTSRPCGPVSTRRRSAVARRRPPRRRARSTASPITVGDRGLGSIWVERSRVEWRPDARRDPAARRGGRPDRCGPSSATAWRRTPRRPRWPVAAMP